MLCRRGCRSGPSVANVRQPSRQRVLPPTATAVACHALPVRLRRRSARSARRTISCFSDSDICCVGSSASLRDNISSALSGIVSCSVRYKGGEFLPYPEKFHLDASFGVARYRRQARLRAGKVPRGSSLHSCVFAADSACWGHSLRSGGCVVAIGCRRELETHDRGLQGRFRKTAEVADCILLPDGKRKIGRKSARRERTAHRRRGFTETVSAVRVLSVISRRRLPRRQGRGGVAAGRIRRRPLP